MSKYSAFYLFAAFVLSFLLMSWLKGWRRAGGIRLFFQRAIFVFGVALSLIFFDAPWILLVIIFMWIIFDRDIIKSARIIMSNFDKNLDLICFLALILVYFVIFIKIFLIG